ncbi:MAG: hypothetical protein KGM24_03980, partial [Elusimicrobia bacterium]|nr:hypothetical protein [Elusimicrobiota bacterium]
ALLAIAAVAAREARALSPLGPASDWQREYPSGSADWLAARAPGRRLFAPYEWGGYLLWRLAPRDRVFVDGRLDPYWTLLGDYEEIIRAAPGWRELLAAYGADAAVLRHGSPLARALARDPAWRAVGADRVSTLYVRRRDMTKP